MTVPIEHSEKDRRVTRPDKQWKGEWDIVLAPKHKAHSRWYHQQGRTGDGRIEMSDANLQGARVRGLQGARFERCDFSGACIHLLDDIEVIDCIFDEAPMSGSAWERARITNCRMHGAWLGATSFEDAVVDGGDWLGAFLEASAWYRASVRGVGFRCASFVDSQLDGATFVDCDFRYANFSRRKLTMDAGRCPDTRFISCDFRGANIEGWRLNNTTFDHCLFNDTMGRPELEGSCTLIEPDFAVEGSDGVDYNGTPAIRDPARVLEVWRSEDRAWINHWSRYGDRVAYEPDKRIPKPSR